MWQLFACQFQLITILIGPNDFCFNLCYTDEPESTVDYHKKDLVTALRTLRDNLSRTMVNLVTPPSKTKSEFLNFLSKIMCVFLALRIITELRGKPLECQSIHHVECPCIFGFRHESKRERYFGIMDRWQEVVGNISKMDEFNTDVKLDIY